MESERSKNALRRYLNFLLVKNDLDFSPYVRVDDAFRIGIDVPKVNGNPRFGPIYHFLREYFHHIPSQDTENLILASSIWMTRSCAAENKIFSKSLSWKYEFSLTSPFSFNFVRRRSIALNEAQKRF
jgi:hypothetical protein